MCQLGHLPIDVLLIVAKYLDGHDTRAFGNACKRFREFVLANKSKLSKPELQWEGVHLVFGRRITLKRLFTYDPCTPTRKRRWESVNFEGKEYQFTDEEFAKNFASLFFVITPKLLYVKCRDFDYHTCQLVKSSFGNLWGKTMALEMDKCSIDEQALKSFLEYFTPFYLHLAGFFDRSLISDQVLPLSTLYTLFIGVNRFDPDALTRVSGISVRKIVNNWFKRYPDICMSGSELRPINDYVNKGFHLDIPDCDLDYNEFFAFLRELILVPHETKERIRIGNLPKTLIHTIYSNLLTYNEVGPAQWVQQGICSIEGTKWSCSLNCDCYSLMRSDHNYFMDQNLPDDPSKMCDTVALNLSISVSKYEEMMRPRRRLLDVWITLKAGPLAFEKFIPENVLVDNVNMLKRRRRSR